MISYTVDIWKFVPQSRCVARRFTFQITNFLLKNFKRDASNGTSKAIIKVQYVQRIGLQEDKSRAEKKPLPEEKWMGIGWGYQYHEWNHKKKKTGSQ